MPCILAEDPVPPTRLAPESFIISLMRQSRNSQGKLQHSRDRAIEDPRFMGENLVNILQNTKQIFFY